MKVIKYDNLGSVFEIKPCKREWAKLLIVKGKVTNKQDKWAISVISEKYKGIVCIQHVLDRPCTA